MHRKTITLAIAALLTTIGAQASQAGAPGSSASPGARGTSVATSASMPAKAAQGAAQKVTFKIFESDNTFEGTLRRWGQDHGWSVVSKGAPEIRVTGNYSFERPSFLAAVQAAGVQAQQDGHSIRAVALHNKKTLVLVDPTNVPANYAD
jgi:hypothetical protein